MIFLNAFNWYGFLIAMGMIVGGAGAYFVARWRGFNGEVAIDICLWAIPLAIVGARLNFVITDAISGGNYSGWNGFTKIFGFDNGEFIGMSGLSIYGGLIGAICGIFINSLIYKKKKRPETFLNMMDLGAPFMILGQSIGRWGNLVNKELYGAVITNPAFQWFPIGVEVGGVWHQALSFYESMLNLVGCALLLWLFLGNRRSRPGFVVGVYFVWYGVVRACLEMAREKEFIMFWGNMPVSLFDSLLLIAAGLGIIIYIIVQARRANKRIPILVKRADWEASTGRSLYEWGRDYHEKLPPLFRRKERAVTEESDEEYDEEYDEVEKAEEIEDVPPVVCPDCGSELEQDATVCPYCHCKIGTSAPPEQKDEERTQKKK